MTSPGAEHQAENCALALMSSMYKTEVRIWSLISSRFLEVWETGLCFALRLDELN